MKNISHSRGANTIDSPKLDMPAPGTRLFVSLKKGDYDEGGAKKYGKLQSGENFKSGGAAKLMQRNLIITGFLPEGSADGFLGNCGKPSLSPK